MAFSNKPRLLSKAILLSLSGVVGWTEAPAIHQYQCAGSQSSLADRPIQDRLYPGFREMPGNAGTAGWPPCSYRSVEFNRIEVTFGRRQPDQTMDGSVRIARKVPKTALSRMIR